MLRRELRRHKENFPRPRHDSRGLIVTGAIFSTSILYFPGQKCVPRLISAAGFTVRLFRTVFTARFTLSADGCGCRCGGRGCRRSRRSRNGRIEIIRGDVCARIRRCRGFRTEISHYSTVWDRKSERGRAAAARLGWVAHSAAIS